MDFSNREIAGYIWLALFVIFGAFNSDMRRAFIDVLRASCQPLVLIPLALAATYIAAWVFAFERLGIWTTANLKTTILWALSFAFATIFDINRVSEDRTFFKKAVGEALAITGILTFIVELYSFSLLVELIAVPLLTLLTMIQIASNKPEYARVKRLVGRLLSSIGLGYLAYSLYRTIIDLEGFATLDNVREFGLPILLTLSFLPFLYSITLYVVYELSFTGLNWAIPDEKLRRQAKWRAIFAFGPKLDLLRRWIGSVQRFKPTDRDSLRRSIREIHTLAKREADPPVVARESGWSPYVAKDFLKAEGLPTRPYHRSEGDEWFAGSNYLEIGGGFGLRNNIAFYLDGNEHAVTELKLKLNINVPDMPEEAERRFREIGLALLSAAFDRKPGTTLGDRLVLDDLVLDDFDIEFDGRRIRLEKNVWHGRTPGYSRRLIITTGSPS